MIKIGIVIATYINYSGLIKCINSIRSEKYQVMFYIYDNSAVNIGVSKAWNIGIQSAMKQECEYILILNDDTILFKDTLDVLVDKLANSKYYALSGTEMKDIWKIDRNPDFSCVLFKSSTFTQLGYFDENYVAYFEDTDLRMRMDQLKMDYNKCIDALFIHEGSHTAREKPQEVNNTYVMSEKYFHNKWKI